MKTLSKTHICGKCPLTFLTFLTFLTSLPSLPAQSTLTPYPGKSENFTHIFAPRTSPNHGAIWNKSKKKGRHTGASPEALSVLCTGGVRGDLPHFQTKNFTVMRTPESDGQTLSKNQINEVVKDFFSMWGSPTEIDRELWSILVASFNSKDTDGLACHERANRLCLYRDISNLIHSLKQAEL